MGEVEFNYNSAEDELIIREYGRNMQKLIRHAKTIEDVEYRQAYVEDIIDLMQEMHPQSRNVADSRAKLWQHIFRIAEYDLEVKTPEGVEPKPEDAFKKPDQLEYPVGEPRYRHYGYNVQRLVKSASEMEDEEKKEGFAQVIGAYMKMAHKNWSRDYNVTNEQIKKDILKMSDQGLELDEKADIDYLVPAGSFTSQSYSSNNKGKKYKHSKGGSYSNNRKNYKGGGKPSQNNKNRKKRY